ncbi:MAG: gliding motility protein [Myxococcaceae bacterium]|nr:gliding motility protein [Myxococcaceae bacterium]
MSASDISAAAPAVPSEASLLNPANFVTRFSAAEPDNRCVRRLHALLVQLDPHAAFSGQAEWLEDLSAWLRQRGRVPGRQRGTSNATARLILLLDALELLPEQLSALRVVVARSFELSDGVRLFTDTGLPTHQAVFTEAMGRLSKLILPEPPVEGDLARLLFRLLPNQHAVAWFESLPPALSRRLLSALAVPSGAGLEPLRASMRDAAVLLAVRVSANGLADEVRRRLSRSSAALRDSPFLALPKLVRVWVTGEKGAGSSEVQCRECIAACRRGTREVVATLDETGVSVDLVYRLELINRQLDRLYALVTVLSAEPIAGAPARLLSTLVRGGVRDRSLAELFRANSKLLAQRVIERAGHGGEHYVTRTRDEQHEMVTSAGGGGALTAFSVFLKFVMGWAGLPPLIDGIANALNYATGFVAMQMLGFTLATKQPAMTAATLAGAIKETTTGLETPEAADLGPLVEQVARAFRSQLAAVVGNLGMVIPGAILLNLGVYLLTGGWLLELDQAVKVVHKHHPFGSATIPYAMLTGVFLWAASIAGGTMENWFVVNKLHEAIASSRGLRSLVGSERSARFARFLLNNISGFGGSVSLGVFLGLSPVLGLLVGIPIEVRHVTFATGQLTFAGLTLGPERVLEADCLWSLAAIGVIGLCNFGVSFSLALFVALRAREVGALAQFGLFRAVLRRFRQAPLDFFRAPKGEGATVHPQP